LRSASKAGFDSYITIAHEATFRLELWFALSKKSFRHQTYPSWLKIKAKNFVDFLYFVRADRRNNLGAAVQLRMSKLTPAQLETVKSIEKDDEVDGVDIDDEFMF
jgi:hypothetical protein